MHLKCQPFFKSMERLQIQLPCQPFFKSMEGLQMHHLSVSALEQPAMWSITRSSTSPAPLME
jgi:hypothetical protein